jgi:hypothetical protein
VEIGPNGLMLSRPGKAKPVRIDPHR